MVDSPELLQSREVEDTLVEDVETVDDVGNSLDTLDQQLEAEVQAKLDSIKQQLVLIEDIMTNHPEKKEEVQETIKKAKQDIAGLKEDANLSDVQKVSLEAYEKKSTELEQSLKPWYEKTWDWVKEKSTNAINYVNENRGKSLAFGATLGIGYLAYKRFTRDKKESNNTSNKKPWYKRWYTWVATGVLGFLGIKYGKDFLKWFEGLFGGDEKKRDQAFETIADNLGSDYTYDKITRTFTYKNGRHYAISDLHKKGLIHTTLDDEGNIIVDIEATQVAIQKHIESDRENQSDSMHDTERTKEKWEVLSSSERMQYDGVATDIRAFTQETQGIDSNIKDGMMIYHLDENKNNIGHLLAEKTFDNFMESTTTSMAEKLFGYMPDVFIAAIQSSAKLSKQLGLHGVASISGNFAKKLRNLQPEFEPALKQVAVDLYEQWTDIAFYALCVRNAYEASVDGDTEKMKIFDAYTLGDLYKGSDAVNNDPLLQQAVDEPLLDTDITKRIEKHQRKEKKLLAQLEGEPSIDAVQDVIKDVIGDIDRAGYNTWAGVFAMLWGHVWENERFMEYDILEQQYEEYMGDMRYDLRSLLNQDDYTADDIDQVKQHVSDFYETMRKIATDVELRQETDEDGNLYTRWKIPVVRMGKVMYQTFSLSKEEGRWMLMGGVLASADLLTAMPRKLGGSVIGGSVPVLGSLLKRIIGFSPTWIVAKALGGKGLQGLGVGAGVALERSTRGMSRWINKYPWLAYTRFDTMEDFVSALEKGRIRLADAAELLSRKTKGNRYDIDWISRVFPFMGKEWRRIGFGADVLQNKKMILQEIPRLKKLVPNMTSKKWDLLVKYRDHPDFSRMLRSHKMTGKAFADMMKGLKYFDSTGNIPASLSGIKIDRLTNSADDLIKSIERSQNKLEKVTKKTFTKFENELSQAAAKKGFKKGTSNYNKLGESLWNSKYQSIINTNKHNQLVMKNEKALLQQFRKMTRAQQQKLFKKNSMVRSLVTMNGGIEKWRAPAFGRTGRMISVGVHAVMLGWIGSSKNAEGNKKDRGEVGVDAADFGLGMVPVAGGLYDIGMAIRGKALNGRDMGTGERFIRGGVGAVTGVLDVFTFGLGGTAIRTVTKGGTRLFIKGGAKKASAQSMEVATKSFTKGAAKQIAKSSATNILVGTTAGLALVGTHDLIRSVPLDEDD